MDIREIVPGAAVAPQIFPGDMPALVAQGYRTVICNRPDEEVPPGLAMPEMRAAAEAAGLRFVENPLGRAGLTEDMLDRQRAALAEGPTLAYCASGTRSTVLWALTEAGARPVDEILCLTAAAGYPLDGLASELAARAGQ